LVGNNQEEVLKFLKSSIMLSQFLLIFYLNMIAVTLIQPVCAWTPGQTRDLWTPRLLINVPYNGRAEGESGWSSKIRFTLQVAGVYLW
jgi:hypothetical protein